MGDLTVNGESYFDLSGSYKVTNAGAVERLIWTAVWEALTLI